MPLEMKMYQWDSIRRRSIKIWDFGRTFRAKANLASNVRQVLDWVATGNAPCGVVYATDAQIEKNVKVVCEAPKEAVTR